MDKNFITGMLLMFMLFMAFNLWIKPPVEEQPDNATPSAAQINAELQSPSTGIPAPDLNLFQQAQAPASVSTDTIGSQQSLAQATPASHSIENEHIKLTLSNKGGIIQQVALKQYNSYLGETVELVNDDIKHLQNYNFFLDGKPVQTQSYIFETASATPQAVTYRLYTSGNKNSYIEQTYRLQENSYLVDYDFKLVGMDNKLNNGQPIELVWQQGIMRQEQTHDQSQLYSAIYYKESQDDVDKLKINKTKKDEERLSFKLDWVSFKQHFFNQTLIAKNNFTSADLTTLPPPAGEEHATELGITTARMRFNYQSQPDFNFPMQFYMGPNDYRTLKSLNIDLQKVIPLGWGIFGWVNKLIIIPLFDFLGKFIGNYGIVILILTLVIKGLLFPLTYRSYKSFAKMNVLKPELSELREKYKDEPQKLQQEQLKLYGKAGVNPIGGCLPQLVQMPILIAMYRFFPASIELRQEPFLWAKDLSTYDNILNLPFTIPFYGDHVSLFCLLSAITSIFYVRLNQSMTPQAGGEMAGQMKVIQYIMPVMLLFFFNNFAAGLTFYFFLSNVISFGQQFAIKKFFIDEDKLHRQIQENKKRPAKQKSKFQQRLDEMMKQQQEAQRRQQEGGGKPTIPVKGRRKPIHNEPPADDGQKLNPFDKNALNSGSNYTAPKKRKRKKK